MNKRFQYLMLLAVIAILSSCNEKKPNVILIFTDDAGYVDFGFVEGAKEDMKPLTPNITKLADNGVVFTNAYVSAPVCGPSRAGLLTGRYQQRFGHELNMPIGCELGMPDSIPMISEYLQDLDYTSGVVGKWGVGYRKSVWPKQRGWDYSFVHLRGQRNFLPIKSEPLVSVFIENNNPTPEEGYSTDRIGQKCVDFITENKDKPFFLFASFNAVHGPLEPRPEDSLLVNQFEDEKRGKYAGLMKALDENVGLIIQRLNDLNLSENTLVIFMNDNGGAEHLGADNGPFRGRKAMLYEGGIRVPCSMTWPGVIEPGTSSDEPIISLDIVPTVLKMAGAGNLKGKGFDGVNLLPLLIGKEKELEKRNLYWRSKGHGLYAIRSDDWKLYHRKEDKEEMTELFNLDEDPYEEQNLIKQHVEIAEELMNELMNWNSELVDPSFYPWGCSSNAKRKDKN